MARLAGHWVAGWTSMPMSTTSENLPPITRGSLAFTDVTLRQTVRITIGGHYLRVQLSNAFGHTPVTIAVTGLARPADGHAGARAIEAASAIGVTFDGHGSVTIPPGACVTSDPVRFPITAGANLTVTLRLDAGQAADGVTSHPGSRTTSYVCSGDHTHAGDLPDAIAVAHWYYLSAVEVRSPRTTEVLALLGDSITDGRESTTDGNDRWPDLLLDRLLAARIHTVAIANQAAGGNQVLAEGLGPSAVSRVERDILALAGVAWLLVFEGVNDIGTTPPDLDRQEQVAANLVAAYSQLVRRAHAHGIRVFGATITPFGGHDDYDDPAGRREATRSTVNHWIRTSGRFDAVLDFDGAVRDPATPARLAPDYDSGDHLHLNTAGFAALAAAVPLQLFGQRRRRYPFAG